MTTLRMATLTAQTPHGFAVAHAGREHIGGNRAPYFTIGVDLYRSRRAFEIGAESHSSGRIDALDVASYFPQLAPLLSLHGAWTDNGEPMHGGANGWYWLGAGAALHTVERREHPIPSLRRDPEYGRIPDHKFDDPDDDSLNPSFMISYVERAASALRVDVADLPNVQDPELFAEWVDSYARPRWQAEADAANALIDRLASESSPTERPSERSEESCTITLGAGDERVSVRADWGDGRGHPTKYREGVGHHYIYRVVVRACGTSYSVTYGGSVAGYEAGKHDARGACTCVLSELRDALSYSSGAEWAEDMGEEPYTTGYNKTVRALDRCVQAAERMRSALEANADEIGR